MNALPSEKSSPSQCDRVHMGKVTAHSCRFPWYDVIEDACSRSTIITSFRLGTLYHVTAHTVSYPISGA